MMKVHFDSLPAFHAGPPRKALDFDGSEENAV